LLMDYLWLIKVHFLCRFLSPLFELGRYARRAFSSKKEHKAKEKGFDDTIARARFSLSDHRPSRRRDFLMTSSASNNRNSHSSSLSNFNAATIAKKNFYGGNFDEDDEGKRKAPAALTRTTIGDNGIVENERTEMTTEDDDIDDDEKRMKILLGEIDPEKEEEEREAKEMEARRKRRREIMESMKKSEEKTTKEKNEGESIEMEETVTIKKKNIPDAPVDAPASAKEEEEETRQKKKKMKKEKDMFDSDSEDMFGESDEEEENGSDANAGENAKMSTTQQKAAAGGTGGAHENNSLALKDNWDDVEGYYRAKLGELLDDGRYEVTETNFGKGVFSSVLKAKDLKSSSFVAIKIIRNNETMRKASKTEIAILKKLSDRDPEHKKHVVQFHRSFEFRGHVFLVFEKLAMNLREAAKKFGRDVGISISAVRVYARQLFVALMHLQKCGIVHADIKPDNVLVNDQLNVLKICDFGSAIFNADNELTPYLASRFYRAPEVVLGLPYSFPIDLWAVGCCLYELYVGKICFPGKSNNEMLKYFVEMKGAVPKKVLRKAAFKEKHFDREENLRIAEVDKVTGKTMFRVFDSNTLSANKTGHLESILSAVCVEHGGDDFERKKVRQLSDLLEKIFILDPERRITASECLQHPFIIDTSK